MIFIAENIWVRTKKHVKTVVSLEHAQSYTLEN